MLIAARRPWAIERWHILERSKYGCVCLCYCPPNYPFLEAGDDGPDGALGEVHHAGDVGGHVDGDFRAALRLRGDGALGRAGRPLAFADEVDRVLVELVHVHEVRQHAQFVDRRERARCP